MSPPEYPDGWVELDPRGRDADAFVRELRREVARGHDLFGVAVTAIARCDGHCDDVMFALDDRRIAIVHLTYTSRRTERPPWPVTTSFENLDDAVDHLRSHLDEA